MVTRVTAQTIDDGVRDSGSDRALHVSTSLSVEKVYEEHARFTWRVLRGMGVPDSQVEDALQDVFMVVHRRLHEFDGRCAVRTWLFAIAYRVACEHRRKHRRTRGHLTILDEVHSLDPSPEGEAEAAQAARLLSTLLDRLSEEKRALLILADVEGLTVPEIASLTKTRLSTTYTRLRRAREQLERELASHRARLG